MEKFVASINAFKVIKTIKDENLPNAAFIGGLAYAPSDFDELVEKLSVNSFVIDNPVHNRKMARIAGWQRDLRQGYQDICNTVGADIIIAHSCGVYDAINIAQNISNLKGIVCIAPPMQKPKPADEGRCKDFGLLDGCLADVCSNIPDERYREMLAEHQKEYNDELKNIYKKEMPAREEICSLLRNVGNSSICSLTIYSKNDPCHDSQHQFEQAPNCTVEELCDGHYPHIAHPGNVASIIQSWWQKINN